MVKQFEDGKVYVLKGSKKPYEEIIEAAVYKSKNDAGQIEKNLMLDRYYFDDRFVPETKGRIYGSGGNLECAINHNPKDYKELGKTEDLFAIGCSYLFEKKPSYTALETALNKIARARNCDFRNWKQRGDEMQKIAQEALRAGR